MASDPAADARIRSFVALDVAGPARDAVESLLARLRATGADVAWTRPDALHVTLKFLGSVAPDRLAQLGTRLAAAAAAQPRFTVRLAGIGGFPSLARARILWVGVEAPELVRLAEAVERACLGEGFAADDRPFHPHLTLGRMRADRRHAARAGGESKAAGRALIDLLRLERERVFGASLVDELILFRSDLGAGGARHSALARFAFAAA